MTEDWRRVGAAIEARMAHLSLTAAEVDRQGVSDKTLKRYLEGHPIVRADKRRQLCQILRWDPRSIDVILAGGDPIIVDGHGPGLEERVSSLERSVAEILAILRQPPWDTPARGNG